MKVIFFDMDGTLLSHKYKEVPLSARKALQKLRQNGIRVVVCTGRSMSELNRLPGNGIQYDGYITLNGSLIYDENKNLIFDVPLDENDKECLIHLFEEKKMPISLVNKDELYANYIDEFTKIAHEAVSSPLPNIKEHDGKEFYLAIAYANKIEEQQLSNMLPNCKITRWNEFGLDIISKNGGKAKGIQKYLEIYHLNQKDTMAFGDGENDIEMLEYVQLGIAMGNSNEQVKAIADDVTDSVDDDGIEHALIKYHLI